MESHNSSPAPSKRILILGSGPTGLGAAYRLQELGYTNTLVLEMSNKPGGLASSVTEDGYTWDFGGHVTFSHYDYYDSVTRDIKCNLIPRESYVWYDSSYVPYPLQQSVSMLKNRKEIQESYENRSRIQPSNFFDYCLSSFGEQLTSDFMKPYNEKVWQTPIDQMSHTWVGERVAAPHFEDVSTKDKKWGPNSTFRYPKTGGNGELWRVIASRLAPDMIQYNVVVRSVDLSRRVVLTNRGEYKYDTLVNTLPLDQFSLMLSADIIPSARKLRSTQLRITGLGFSSPLPEELHGKSWIYYAGDEPCYRVTVLSSYSSNMVPEGKWSLLCESNANISVDSVTQYYSRYGTIEKVWSVCLDHGYPIPTVDRDEILGLVQSTLEEHSIYSRGRFGGWKYEVSNQDHSFMQGVEVIDRILLGCEEITYQYPNKVNTPPKVLSTRVKQYPIVELVIAAHMEDLSWLEQYRSHVRLYVKNPSYSSVDYRYTILPNVGRETHTYLTHIISNWEHLADVTIFNQGRIDDHLYYTYANPFDHLQHLQNGASFKVRERYDNWGRMTHKDPWLTNLVEGRMRPAKYTLARTWFDLFGYNHPNYINVCYCACFAVSRQQIQKRPLEFYRKCLSYVSDCNDPEDSHYFERLWISVFTDDEVLQSQN